MCRLRNKDTSHRKVSSRSPVIIAFPYLIVSILALKPIFLVIYSQTLVTSEYDTFQGSESPRRSPTSSIFNQRPQIRPPDLLPSCFFPCGSTLLSLPYIPFNISLLLSPLPTVACIHTSCLLFFCLPISRHLTTCSDLI